MCRNVNGELPTKCIRLCYLSVLLLAALSLLAGCSRQEPVRDDGYRYLIGVSLTNVLEPWLSNLAKITAQKASEDKEVNLIIMDAAGSNRKQAEDIEALRNSGIDLLIMATDGSAVMDEMIDQISGEIPVVVVGVEPGTDSYTTMIRADDKEIGRLAGAYITDSIYTRDQRIVVVEGNEDSPISQQRREGFLEAVSDSIPDDMIFFCNGEWLRDTAETRMKDYLLLHEQADVVFAFNDEMAYGAYLSCQEFRVERPTVLIGVDGFDGESEGLHLVEDGILDATIQSPDLAALSYDLSRDILEGVKVEKNITIYPKLIAGNGQKE